MATSERSRTTSWLARSPHTVISNLRKVASEHASSVHYSPCPPDSCSRISAAHDRGKAGPCLEAVEVHRIADVFTRGVAERREIPSVDLALAQRCGDEPASALAQAHAPVRSMRSQAPLVSFASP